MSTNTLLLSIAEAAKRLTVTKKSIYSWHKKDPAFPRVFRLSGKKSVIVADELDAWVAARRAGHRIDGKEGGAQ